MPERIKIEQHLAEAERHVAQGQRLVARQRELIAELEHDGHDTEAAQVLLAKFEEVQAQYLAACDQLRAELAEIKD
jgi:hypothetical protein